jgi:hypothetical protein
MLRVQGGSTARLSEVARPCLAGHGLLLPIGDEPQTSKTGLRYHRPISVYHPEFIIHLSAFTLHKSKLSVVSRQLSV